jgi:hypothetical protein
VIEQIWLHLKSEYFPNETHLNNYKLVWSTRPQKRTLASCNLLKYRIVVAQELNDPLFYYLLSPLIYHEMCHAALALNVVTHRGKRQWHGKQFKILERRHPEIPVLDDWIKSGGWRYAVARHRARQAYLKSDKAFLVK